MKRNLKEWRYLTMKRKVLAILCLIIVAGFSTGYTQDLPAEQAKAGITVAVPDVWLFKTTIDNRANWEPFTDIFGDGTMAVSANTFPETADGMNAKVAFIDPKTGKVEEYWMFYDDSGKVYTGPFNEKRNDGNPTRIAADNRPGGTRYIVGMEATPQYYSEFNTGDRWFKNFDYDDRVAVVQIFDKTATGPKPVTNVFDPIYMPGNLAGAQNAAQMRFGGDVQFLSNGNILAVIEDRTKNIVPAGNGAVGSVFDNNGKLIKGPINMAGDDGSHDSWSNLAAFNGGFCVRACNVFTVFDNAGNMLYWFDQGDFSTVKELGRGDGVRIASNINTNFVYFCGKDEAGAMVVTRFDAVATKKGDQLQGVKEIFANELEFAPNTFDRADMAVDEFGNFCVTYMDKSATDVNQIVARVFNDQMDPVTPTFFVFGNHDGVTGDVKGFVSSNCNITMNNQYILIAAKGLTWDKDANTLSPANSTICTVLNNPQKKAPVYQWDLY